MHKKRILSLMLLTCLLIACMFLGVNLLMKRDMQELKDPGDLTTEDESNYDTLKNYDEILDQEAKGNDRSGLESKPLDQIQSQSNYEQVIVSSNPYEQRTDILIDENNQGVADVIGETVLEAPDWQLILDSSEVDYMKYVPEIIMDDELEAAFKNECPQLNIDAKAAILFDVNTKEVLYYKNPVLAVFPASTAKLLTALVALEWCDIEENIQIGDEITMIAIDSTRAYLDQGEILTLQNLLEGMLLPSGNDAAYSIAAYVGRKSLENKQASNMEAVLEFVRLMNKKAKELGVKNSCFKTPDGYDAFGQYTTAYDMGLIGVAAAQNEVIVTIGNKARSRNIFVSGEDVTWENTNRLINRYSGQYYSKALGLKTGTSTMAGRCLISAASDGTRDVVCVVMNSSVAGRWEDAIKLLKYGLNR